ncbi:MAG: TonB-dependent receptor [Balneolia bacterium]|nr:TonB-dependent receptor [Balneolia bacterium]
MKSLQSHPAIWRGMMMAFIIAITISTCILNQTALASVADTDTILEGQVLHVDTHAPIEGAHVSLNGESFAVTAQNGSFQIRIQDINANSELTVSHVGFHRYAYPLHAATQTDELIRIYLRPYAQSMSPVTVVAHHTMGAPRNGLDITEATFTSIDSGSFLREADNVSGVRRGGFGIDPVVRGQSGSRLNIRLDGLSTTAAACPNRMDPPTSHIRLSDIERVEIHHGPHALQFGPAFGGTVDFIKHKQQPSEHFRVQGDVRAGFESNTSNRITDARLLLGSTRYDILLSGGLSGTGSYTAGNGESVAAGFQSADYGAEARFRPDADHEFSIGWSQSFVRDADFPALPMDMAIDDTYKFNAGYSWEPEQPGTVSSLSLNAYHTLVDHEMNNHNRASFEMRDAVALAETKTWGAHAKADGLSNQIRWTVAGGVDHLLIDGTRFVDFKMGPNAGNSMQYNLWQDSRITNAGLFAGSDYFLNSWTLSAGIRLDYNYADARNPAPRFEGKDLSSEHINISFSAGISRDLWQSASVSLYAGRGVRSPDVTERFINFLAIGRNPFEFAGNPNLSPETNNQLDLVFGTQIHNLSLQMNGFISLMQNYISGVINPELMPMGADAPGVREFQNRGDAFFTGFEFSAAYTFFSDWNTRLSSSYTYAEFVGDESGPVAEIPPLEAKLQLNGAIGRNIYPELMLRRAFPQTRFDASFGEQRTSGFWLADIGTRVSLHNTLTLSAGIRNLFDENYTEHLNRNFNPDFAPAGTRLPEPGRRFFAELSWRF